jgi:hypothetical protein
MDSSQFTTLFSRIAQIKELLSSTGNSRELKKKNTEKPFSRHESLELETQTTALSNKDL